MIHAGVCMGDREKCNELSDLENSCLTASPGRGAPITLEMNAETPHKSGLDVAFSI